jgi:hypothetical protein
MQHYDNPAWQPWLIVAMVGAVVILGGASLTGAKVGSGYGIGWIRLSLGLVAGTVRSRRESLS